MAKARDAHVGAVERSTRRWLFGPAVLDEVSRELRVNDGVVHLERKPLETLIHLLHHAGEVVTKQEIQDAVWPGRFLSESVLTNAISRIRDVLGDADQRIVKTVHGYGYRLMAPVRIETRTPAPPPHFGFQAGDSPPLRPDWRLERRLDAGAHGEVWLAHHAGTGESRVYKFALDGDALASLKREITLFRVLSETLPDTRSYARLLDWNLSQAPYFIESEFIKDGNLAAWFDAQGAAAIPLELRLELVAQVADALAAAHSVGVLHKDLKPANVLVDFRDGRPVIRLADFGSGAVLDPQRLEQLGITRRGFTRAVSGADTSATLLYLAPEVLTEQPFTTQSDIYALGVILYQFVVGDFRRALAPGWENDIDDLLLRQDIGAAADGDPRRRLGDAGQLAQRLRSLSSRRETFERECAVLLREREMKAAYERLRTRRRTWAAVFAVLIVGLATSTKLYVDARVARNEAQAVSAFLTDDVLPLADPYKGPLKDLTLQTQLDRAAKLVEDRFPDQPGVRGRIHTALGYSYSWLVDFEGKEKEVAIKEMERGVQLLGEAYGRTAVRTQDAVALLGRTYLDTGRREEGQRSLREAIENLSREVGDHDFSVLEAKLELLLPDGFGNVYGGEGLDARIAELQDLAGSAVSLRAEERQRDTRPEDFRIDALFDLQWMLNAAGRYKESEIVAREYLMLTTGRWGESHYAASWARLKLGDTLAALGQYGEAETLLKRARVDFRGWLGASHPQAGDADYVLHELYLSWNRPKDAAAALGDEVAWCLHTQPGCKPEWYAFESGNVQLAIGQPASAARSFEAAVASAESLPGHEVTARLARSRIGLADALRATGDRSGADAVLATFTPAVLARLGSASGRRARALLAREEGLQLMAQHRFADAVRRLRDAVAQLEPAFGPGHWTTNQARRDLASAEALARAPKS